MTTSRSCMKVFFFLIFALLIAMHHGLGSLSFADDIDRLCADLVSRSPDIRERALERMSTVDDLRLVMCLKNRLGNRFVDNLKATVEALQHLKVTDPQAIELLLPCLNDPMAEVASGAAIALSGMGPPAAEKLAQIVQRESKERPREARESALAAVALGRMNDDRAIKPLMKAMCKSARDVEEHVKSALLEMADTGPTEAWIEVLQQTRCFALREVAVEILGKKRNDPQLVDRMVALMRDHQLNPAARVLGKLGDRRAVEPLVAAFKRADAQKEDYMNGSQVLNDRLETLRALADLSHRRAVDPLLNILRQLSKEKNYLYRKWGREAVIEGLGKVADKDERAKNVLVGLLCDHEVNKIAATHLERIGWQPPSEEDRIRFLAAGQRVEELRREWEFAKRVLMEDSNSNDQGKQGSGLRALIRVGDESTISYLIERLEALGNVELAQFYLSSGEPSLRSAAKAWAARRIIPIVEAPYLGPTSNPNKWGSQ